MGAVSGKEPLCNAVKACYSGDYGAVEEFLQQHPHDIDTISPLHNHTLLYGAARNGHYEIVRLLLAPGEKGLKSVPPADVNKACGRSKSTPLHAAAFYGKVETAKLLYKTFGARADIKNIYGFTAVQEATEEVRQIVFPDEPFEQPLPAADDDAISVETNVALTYHVGHAYAIIIGAKNYPNLAEGKVTSEVGERVAFLWNQLFVFALEKFYPPKEFFDVQPMEIQISWQLKPNIGLGVTAAVHLLDKGLQVLNMKRANAARHALETMIGLDTKDWEEIAIFNGVKMKFRGVDVNIEDDPTPKKDESDIPPVALRTAPADVDDCEAPKSGPLAQAFDAAMAKDDRDRLTSSGDSSSSSSSSSSTPKSHPLSLVEKFRYSNSQPRELLHSPKCVQGKVILPEQTIIRPASSDASFICVDAAHEPSGHTGRENSNSIMKPSNAVPIIPIQRERPGDIGARMSPQRSSSSSS